MFCAIKTPSGEYRLILHSNDALIVQNTWSLLLYSGKEPTKASLTI
jgi:hypothetical protein